MKNIRLLVILVVLFSSAQSFAVPCVGKFVNPITDVCWSCLFPLSIGPVHINMGGGVDTPNPSDLVCLCPKPPLPIPVPGVPIGFWEPVNLVDVTRTPYCLVNLGGISLGGNIKGHGGVGATDGENKHSFYQVHWYKYPLIYWLELLIDFICLEQGGFDLAYMSELDPQWNDDELNFILNPEAVLFGNPLAQAACAVDCAQASTHFGSDKLFWCAGCQGSIYPFGGSISGHSNGVQASTLIATRTIARLHRAFLLMESSGRGAMCQKQPAPIIKKSQYKLQMTYPIPATSGMNSCNPLGKSDALFNSGKEFPYKGEDFGYLVWRKRNCCAF
jgi:conjugal transfer pilus assembly protein TraU